MPVSRVAQLWRERGDAFVGTELDSHAAQFFPGRALTEDEVFGEIAAAADDPWPPCEGAARPWADLQPGAGPGPGPVPEPAGAEAPPAYGVVDTPAPELAGYREEDIVWVTPPPSLMGNVMVGWVHTQDQCPVMVVRVLNDDQTDWIELAGSCAGVLDLAMFLAKVTRGITCIAHGLAGPQPLRGPAVQRQAG